MPSLPPTSWCSRCDARRARTCEARLEPVSWYCALIGACWPVSRMLSSSDGTWENPKWGKLVVDFSYS